MLRGFVTTLGVVTTMTLGAWAFTDQSRTATADNNAVDAASVAAPKGDRLAAGGDVWTSGYGASHADARIFQAHSRVAEENASSDYMTVAKRSGPGHTVLIRVPVEK